MNSMNYIGLDIHKKSISCCVRQADGTIMQEGTIPATRDALDNWMKQLPQPWMAGMEATLRRGTKGRPITLCQSRRGDRTNPRMRNISAATATSKNRISCRTNRSTGTTCKESEYGG